MRRLALTMALAGVGGLATTAQVAAAQPRIVRSAAPAARPTAELALFRSRPRFGGSSRGFGFGGFSRGRRRPGLLHRVVKTAIWLYVLHLFFTHGGVSILLWIVIIALVVALVRRRRRRYAY